MKLTRLCATVAVVLTCEFIANNTARATALIWTNQDGTFSVASNWSPPAAPAGGDSTTFTNNTSYTVTFTASTPLLVTNSFNGKGTVTLNIGAANTWQVTNFFSVGRAGNATTTVFLASGTIVVTNTITATPDIRVGDAGTSAGTFNVTNGTVVTQGAAVGANSGDPGTLTISGSGVWTNAATGIGTITIGSAMFGNQLIISNGGKVFTSTGTLGTGAGGSNNVALVVGAGSVWNNSGVIAIAGGANANNSVTVSNGGALNSGTISVGNSTFSSNSVLNVGGLGLMSTVTVSSTATILVPNAVSSALAKLTVTNALLSCGSLNFAVNNAPGATNNTINVLAGGTCDLNAKRLASGGFNNTMTINAGVVTNVSDFRWGINADCSATTLIVTNGGKLFTGVAGASWNIGDTAGAFNHTVNITGIGSMWDASNRTVNVGNASSSNNTLRVSDSGVFTNGSLTVGN